MDYREYLEGFKTFISSNAQRRALFLQQQHPKTENDNPVDDNQEATLFAFLPEYMCTFSAIPNLRLCGNDSQTLSTEEPPSASDFDAIRKCQNGRLVTLMSENILHLKQIKKLHSQIISKEVLSIFIVDITFFY